MVVFLLWTKVRQDTNAGADLIKDELGILLCAASEVGVGFIQSGLGFVFALADLLGGQDGVFLLVFDPGQAARNGGGLVDVIGFDGKGDRDVVVISDMTAGSGDDVVAHVFSSNAIMISKD
jgi:hypothetical protein